MNNDKQFIPNFGLTSSLFLLILNKLKKRYEKKENSKKAIFCHQAIILHLGYYIPNISNPLHAVRQIFFLFTIFRIIGIMPAFFGFKWLDNLRVCMSDKIEFLLKNIQASLPIKNL